MSTDLTFNDNFINKFGGLYWAYKRKNGTDTWHTGVGRIKTKSMFGQDSTPITWEDGSQGPSIDDIVKTEFQITTPDDSYELEAFLKDETVAQTFEIVMEAGKTYSQSLSAVAMKYRFFAEVKINRKYESDAPGREPVITIVPQYNATATTFAGLSAIDVNQTSGWLPTSLTASMSCPVGKYYSLTAV